MLRKVLVICAMACAASGSAESETPKIEYTLSIPQPQTHLFQIEVDIQGLDEPGSTFPCRSGPRVTIRFSIFPGGSYNSRP